VSVGATEGFLDIAGSRLEYRLIGPPPNSAATIVLLHEGLGSTAMWRDFPDRLAEATGAGIFAYSRAGYGSSSPAALPRDARYMHDEAYEVLPAILEAIGFRRGLLVGHSDGASIATLYLGGHQDHRVRGLTLIAPHFVVEEVTLRSIAAAKEAFATTDLKQRLARWHDDPVATFRGWNDIWLDPVFSAWDISEALDYIRVPVQIVQGTADEYGTARQIEIAEERCYCPLEIEWIEGAGHSPQRDRPEETLARVAGFARHVLENHGEGRLDSAA
jgi:pimeloyl-ACP methyl ester carboxylesterase